MTKGEKKYKDNMDNERAPSGLLPEGQRELKIVSMEDTISKQGNAMFLTQVRDTATGDEQTIYLVSVQGKRWMLKSLLDSVGITKDNDGNYLWDIEDVVERVVSAKVVHQEESYLDNNAQERTSTKSRIMSFSESTIAWDEDK